MQQEMKLRRRIAGGAMACVLSCGLMVPQLAFATPDSSSKQAEAQAVLASLNSMQYKLDQASADYGQALEEQAQAQQSADQAQERIDQINVEIADVQSRLGDRAQSMYRTGASSFLDLLLGSTTFSEFATNWDLLNKVNDNDAELVQRNKDLRTEAQEQKATFEEQSRTAAAKASEAKQIQDEAQATVNSMQQTYDGLSAEVATLVEEERAAQAAAAAATAQQTVDQSAAQATQRMGIAGATNTNANAGGNGGNGGAADNGGGNTWTDDSGDAGNAGWTDNGNSGNNGNSGGSSSWHAVLQRLHGQCHRRSCIQLHRRAVRVGRRRPRRLRLLRSGQLCADRQLFALWHHVHVHGHVPGLRPAARRHLHQLVALRHLYRRRPDDPCPNLRPDGMRQLRAVRHDHRSPLVAFPASAARRQAFKLAASKYLQ